SFRERIATLEKELSLETTHVQSLREELSNRQQNESAQRQRVSALEEQVARLKEELAPLYGSLICRVTRPLRPKSSPISAHCQSSSGSRGARRSVIIRRLPMANFKFLLIDSRSRN